MASHGAVGGIIAAFEKYIFHFLPGLPVLAGFCLILWGWCGLDSTIERISKIIHQLQFHNSLAGGLTLSVLTIFFVFLLGMIVDAVRHLIEYAFLIPKWGEHKVARGFGRIGKTENLESRWDILDRLNLTEYFYTEFFGNLALSLAFLWAVIIWKYPETLPLNCGVGLYIFWMHVIFIIRAFLAPAIWEFQKHVEEEWGIVEEDEKEKQKQRIQEMREKGEVPDINKYKDRYGEKFWEGFRYARWNVFLFRIWDFSATFFSILLLIILWFIEHIHTCTNIHAFHFNLISVFVIMASFEVYIVRFKRYKEFMTELFCTPVETKSGFKIC